MTTVAFGTFLALVGLIVGQALLVYGFSFVLCRRSRDSVADEGCPQVAVVLCLRGTDPFLERCVDALLGQDYPNFEVRIVVDSRDDPAWPVVEAVVQRIGAPNATIDELTERRTTCSLKCSSVVQAISRLDDSVEVVALLDADTVPHPTWLRELVAPLADERVGAATGNRWYMPDEPSFAALIRYIWNAAAIVQMYWYHIAWGGTLAIKTSVLRRTDLLDRWTKSFCEDTMIYRALRKENLKVAFVPSLMMINRESCELGGFFRWVRRQLLTARLYHPFWLAVAFHGVITTLAPLASLVTLVIAALLQNWTAAAWAGGGLIVYQCSIFPILTPMELAVRTIAKSRGEPTRWMSVATYFKYIVSIPLTQVVYSVAFTSALFLRKVDWRGVEYRIGGPFDIQMIEDKPFAQDAASEDASLSL